MHKLIGGWLTAVVLVATAVAVDPVGAAAAGDPVPLRESPVAHDQPAAGRAGPAGRQATGTTDLEVRGDDAAIREAVDAVDGRLLGTAPGVVHARVPAERVEELAAHDGVDSVGPAPALLPSTTSEGVASTGAATWHGDGTDGTGVDVAIVDIGFSGYADAITAGELPPGTITSFGQCVDPGLTDHGVATSEIVHDMAPGATLHLLCTDSAFDLDSSSDPIMSYLRNNDIEVANASFGSNLLSRGDGTGAVDMAIAQSRRDGTLWTVSAGNLAQTHSRLPKGSSTQRLFDNGGSDFFVDAVDVDPGTGIDRWMRFAVGPGDGNDDTAEAMVEMKWEGWTDGAATDFDVYAFSQPTLNGAYFVNGSLEDQTVGDFVPPVEGFAISNPSSNAEWFYLLVDVFQPTSAAIDLYFTGSTGLLEHPVAAGSLSEPATSPGALTVGAACVQTGGLEPYSSQGPTVDGRVKPDLVAPDGTDSSVYGDGTDCSDGFIGTSAAAPHVAGAAALVLDAQPGLGPTDVQSILERRATPAGAAGKDSLWGWGQLALGAADAPSAPTGHLYTGLSPSQRALDTRVTSNPLGGGSTRQIQIAGSFGVPADATAVVLSLVALRPSAQGYLTAFPSGAARPVASSLNFSANQIVSNSVTVGLGPNGAFNLFNFAGTTNVVVDVAGWYGPTGTSGLATLAPIRAVDTRPGTSTRIQVPGGDIGGSEVLNVQLAGNTSIPEVPATATAVVLNAAVIAPTITGHLTVWPNGVPKPLASNLNFSQGATVANLIVATVGTGGRVVVAANGGKAHVVLDILGYFDVAAPGRFVPLPTVYRVRDSRTGNGGVLRPVPANQTQQVPISELHGVPGNAVGVVLNVTAIKPTAATGHFRVWGQGPLPTASTLNYTSGAVVGNAAWVGLGPSAALADGWFGIFNSAQGPSDAVADASGYFINAP